MNDVIINELIAIGKHFPAPVQTLLGPKYSLKPGSIVIDEHKWDHYTSNLSLVDLSNLLKGVVLILDMEEISPFIHRKNANHIRHLFKHLQRRDYVENGNYEFSSHIADQLLANTERYDVPLGAESNFGAKTYEELLKKRLAFHRWREHVNDRLKERMLVADCHRKVRKEQCKNTATYRGTDVHKKHLEQLSKLSIQEQLVKLANDDKYSVGFYPARMAYNANINVIDKLDEDIKVMLMAKLKGKKRGAWGRFKKRLLKSYQDAHPGGFLTPWDRNCVV